MNRSVQHKSLLHTSIFEDPYNISNHKSTRGREQRSNFKAELVRNELLSRSDLMKLYQPPLKKAQLPTNNPFYTKSIVGAMIPQSQYLRENPEIKIQYMRVQEQSQAKDY